MDGHFRGELDEASEAFVGQLSSSLRHLAADVKWAVAGAIESIADGVVLYDQDERLLVCNDQFRDIHALSAPALVPGARYEDILRYGLAHGQYIGAIGREEAWLAERLNARLQQESSTELQLQGGRWVRVIERAAASGGRVGVCFDVTDQKRQESRLANILAGSDLGTWEWNVQTNALEINARCAELVGYSLAALAPLSVETFRRLCHPDDLALVDERMARHLGGETSFFEAELRLRHAAGHWVWVLSRGRVGAWTTDGRPEWVSGTHKDISHRARQQREAIDVRNQLDATLRAIPDQLTELDGDGRILDFRTGNPAMASMAVDTFIGRTIDEVLPADVAAITRAALGEARTTGHSTGHEYRLRLNDHEHWFELSVATKRVEGGVPPSFIVVARDISRRKELERGLAAQRDFLDQIMAANLMAIVVVDARGRPTFVSKAAEDIAGASAAELLGRRFDEAEWGITTVDGAPVSADELPCAEVLATGASQLDSRFAFERRDGQRRMVSINASLLAAATDRRVVCSLTDITDKIEAERALAHQTALLRGLFELCPVGISLTDLGRGAFIDVNNALLAPTGFSRDELMQRTIWDLTPEAHWRQEILLLATLAQSGRYGPFEKEYLRKDGSRFPVLVRGSLITDLSGRKLVWSIVEDISDRKAAEAQIVWQAHYDQLTGLPNRRLFQERLAGALERARHGRHLGAVAMLDLDNFKAVNDSLGHNAGDTILVEAAARLTGCTRATDTVARYGGDEFQLLLDDLVSIDVAGTVARKIRRAFAHPFTVEGREVTIGASIGVALFPNDNADADELLRLADIAMYRAKKNGRNQVCFYTSTASP